MITKKFEEPIHEYFERIAHIRGTLFHLDVSFTNYIKNYKGKTSINGYILAYRLIIGDLTGPTDNGWKLNYPTDATHSVKLSDLRNEIKNLIERETSYSLAQGFESFSTYLRNIIASYFKHKQDDAIKFKIITENDLTNHINWKTKIREYNPRANNDKLFKLLRKASLNFKNVEIINNSGINLKDWYASYSFYRHKITHSNGDFSLNEYDFKKLTRNQVDYLKQYFSFIEKENLNKFKLTKEQGNKNLELLSEYAFMIFKELSILLNYNWKILDNMK